MWAAFSPLLLFDGCTGPMFRNVVLFHKSDASRRFNHGATYCDLETLVGDINSNPSWGDVVVCTSSPEVLPLAGGKLSRQQLSPPTNPAIALLILSWHKYSFSGPFFRSFSRHPLTQLLLRLYLRLLPREAGRSKLIGVLDPRLSRTRRYKTFSQARMLPSSISRRLTSVPHQPEASANLSPNAPLSLVLDSYTPSNYW